MQRIKFDYPLLIILMCIIGYGIIVSFSASSPDSLEIYGHLNYFLDRNLIFTLLGITIMIFVAKVKMHIFRNLVIPLNIMTFVFLMMTYIPQFQVHANGADRWVNLFGITFQPSEVAKITFIFTICHMLDRFSKKGVLNKLNRLNEGVIPLLLYVVIYLALVYLQPHLSATVILAVIFISLALIAGIKKIYVILLGVVGVVGAVFGILAAPYRLKRITGFLHPEENALNEGFQVIQGWYGLGSGEWFGLGLGMGRQKFTWLPENHTDFIVAVIGEELGFLFGILILIVLFIVFTLRGLTIATQSDKLFSGLIVSGVTLLIFYQFALNMAVVGGLMPVTGVTLPFISYGGSSTMILYIGLGFIFNVTSSMKREEKNET